MTGEGECSFNCRIPWYNLAWYFCIEEAPLLTQYSIERGVGRAYSVYRKFLHFLCIMCSLSLRRRIGDREPVSCFLGSFAIADVDAQVWPLICVQSWNVHFQWHPPRVCHPISLSLDRNAFVGVIQLRLVQRLLYTTLALASHRFLARCWLILGSADDTFRIFMLFSILGW